MPSHTTGEVLKSFDRKLAARVRKEQKEKERRAKFKELSASMKESGLLLREFLRLAHFGFYLACFVALIAMVTFLFFVTR